MAKTRLGLAAAVGSYMGPWILANGARKAVARVHGLGPDSELLLVLNSPRAQRIVPLREGDNPVETQNVTQYQIRKRAPADDAVPTTVEFEYPEEPRCYTQ